MAGHGLPWRSMAWHGAPWPAIGLLYKALLFHKENPHNDLRVALKGTPNNDCCSRIHYFIKKIHITICVLL
jgi:hypothetical protein